MAGLNHQACGALDLASAARCADRALLQSIPIKMKSPTSVRKVTLMIATVRNTSLAERRIMNASRLPKPREEIIQARKCFGSKRRRREMRAAPASEAA